MTQNVPAKKTTKGMIISRRQSQNRRGHHWGCLSLWCCSSWPASTRSFLDRMIVFVRLCIMDVTDMCFLFSEYTMSATPLGLAGESPALETASTPAVGPGETSEPAGAMPEGRTSVQEGDPSLPGRITPPVLFASGDVRDATRPAGLGAINRRSSSSSSHDSRGRSTSARPFHDRHWHEVERKERQLHRMSKEMAVIQGTCDNLDRQISAYTEVVNVEASTVHSCRRERDSVKAGETAVLQELAAIRGVLKVKVFILHAKQSAHTILTFSL